MLGDGDFPQGSCGIVLGEIGGQNGGPFLRWAYHPKASREPGKSTHTYTHRQLSTHSSSHTLIAQTSRQHKCSEQWKNKQLKRHSKDKNKEKSLLDTDWGVEKELKEQRRTWIGEEVNWDAVATLPWSDLERLNSFFFFARHATPMMLKDSA